MIKKKELRKKIIQDKINSVIDSLDFVEQELPNTFEDFNSRIIRNAIYKEIEFAMQNIIDICAIINSDLRLGAPETEDSIFDHLEKNKIFAKQSMNKIREMKSFRNILVHRYGDIDDKRAFISIKEGLRDFALIINEIEKFLKKF